MNSSPNKQPVKKRRHAGRMTVLLDRKATPIVRELAKQSDRSHNYIASRAVVAYRIVGYNVSKQPTSRT